MRSRYIAIPTLITTAILTACGGGGGSGGTPAPTGLRAPSALVATELAGGQIQLTWQDNATAETGYRVLARDAAVAAATPQAISADLPANTSSFAVAGLLPGVGYDLLVEAFNEAGQSQSVVSVQVDGGAARAVAAYFEVQQGVYYEAGIAGAGNQTFGTAAPAPVGGTVIGLADGGVSSADYFVAKDVPAGSLIVLSYLEPKAGEDLDLDVFNTDLNLTGFSAAPAGEDEEVPVASLSTVLIRVRRENVNGAGDPQKYSLSVLTPAQQLSYSPMTTSTARSMYSSESQMLSYTAIMVDPRGASKTRQRSLASENVNRVYANKRGGTVERVAFQRPAAQRSFMSAGKNEIADKRDTVRLVKEYARMNRGANVFPAVKIEQAAVTFATGTPPTSDPLAASDWQFAAHNGAEGWLWTRGLDADGDPVTVGVVDGGIYPTADLADALLDGYWVYRNPEDPFGPLVTNDFQVVGARGDGIVDNHGNQVAGIIASERNNGVGNTGYIPDAKILPVRTTAPGESGIDNGAIIAALEWATDNGAEVINLSTGSAEQGWTTVRTGVWYAISNDVPVIGAAGNSGSRMTPSNGLVNAYGRDDGAWAVSAYARSGARASYSSYGPYVDVAAAVGESPGVCTNNILGTVSDPINPDLSELYEGTSCQIGTSFSAPVVAAAVGMMKAINPDLTNIELQALLQAGELTNADSGGAFTEDAGYGVIDFGKAARAAAATQMNTAMVNVSGDLDFASFRDQMPLTIDRDGFPGHSLQFTGVPAGITISAVDADDAGFGEYVVTYDRAVAAQSVSATITVTTNEGKMDTFTVAGYTADAGDEAASYESAAEVMVMQGGSVLATGTVEAVGPRTLRYHASKADAGFTLDSTTYTFVLSYDADADGNAGEAGEAEHETQYTTAPGESALHTTVLPEGVAGISMM